jgi:RNA polymerase sigma-70 factor, ECF subfamily
MLATPLDAAGVRSSADEDLVAKALRGEVPAARQIWKRYAPLVTRILHGYCGSSPDVSDLKQEVFLRVFQRLETLRRAEAIRPFIAGICVRVARNHVRQRRLRSIVGLLPDVDWFAAPVADSDTRDALRRLGQLLEKMTAQDRSLFVSRYVARMGLDEIASAYRMSLATTRRRVARLTRRVSLRAKGDTILQAYVQGSRFDRCTAG